MVGSNVSRLRQRKEQRLNELMGERLRTGALLAALVVLIGGVVYLTRHGMPVTNYQVFRGEPNELRTMSGILHEALALRGRGLIQLGLLILIATPIARVAFSFCAFLYQRDWLYVVVMLMVLGLLLYSLVGGHA